jgi:dipeptidyl aminopeptidase/acylaminoacyl peptidase
VQHATTGSPNSALPLVVTLTDPPFRAMQGVFYQPIYDADSMQSTDGRTISANSNHSVAVLNSQLFVVDTRTHITRQLTANGSSYFNPSWFPGAYIICAHVDGGGPVFRAKATNIITVEPESGLILERTRGDGIKYRPTWSADGARFAFLASQHAFSQVGVYVGSRLNQNITYASSRLDRQIYDYRWSSHGDQILLRYRDGVSTPFSAIDLGSGRLTEIATTRYGDSPRSVAAIAAARSGVVAWLQRDVGSDGVLRYRTPGKPIRDLIDLYPEMQAWKRGQVRIVRWTNTQGDEKEGTLLTPVGYQIGRRYPLIVDAYPLVGGSTWTQPLGGNQAWASQGYAVFRPSPRAPIAWLNGWKSQASSLAGKGPGGWEVTVDDVLSGVDELIRTGIVDADRMCLYGHSSGGGVVDYLVTRTNRFKCAVSVAPALSDWVRRALFETDAGWLVDWAGVSLWDDPNAYVALSAVFRANLVRTPMLIAVGDKDNPCLLDSIEMYNGLRTAGVNVSLVRYPDQGHVFTGEALNDLWNRETMFFARYLMQ